MEVSLSLNYLSFISRRLLSPTSPSTPTHPPHMPFVRSYWLCMYNSFKVLANYSLLSAAFLHCRGAPSKQRERETEKKTQQCGLNDWSVELPAFCSFSPLTLRALASPPRPSRSPLLGELRQSKANVINCLLASAAESRPPPPLSPYQPFDGVFVQ